MQREITNWVHIGSTVSPLDDIGASYAVDVHAMKMPKIRSKKSNS